MKPKWKMPPVHGTANGTFHVSACDILMSEVGREEIQKAASVAIALGLRTENYAANIGWMRGGE